MSLLEMLSQTSLVALLSLVVTLLPMLAGVAYAVRPNEARLAVMRPVSLAGLFGALAGTIAGVVNILRYVATRSPEPLLTTLAPGLSEALVPLFVGCASLTVAWLSVAVGLRRTTLPA